MDQIHSMTVIMFKSNPFNLAISYNYFSTHHCEDCTKNGLIFTLWSISSDSACFTLTSCCDTAFLMALTKLNNIDDKAREYKPLRQQTGFLPFFFPFTDVVIAFPNREHEFKCYQVKPQGFIIYFPLLPTAHWCRQAVFQGLACEQCDRILICDFISSIIYLNDLTQIDNKIQTLHLLFTCFSYSDEAFWLEWFHTPRTNQVDK